MPRAVCASETGRGRRLMAGAGAGRIASPRPPGTATTPSRPGDSSDSGHAAGENPGQTGQFQMSLDRAAGGCRRQNPRQTYFISPGICCMVVRTANTAITCSDVPGSGRGHAGGCTMADLASSGPPVRRRALLAAGGIALISARAPGMLQPGPPDRVPAHRGPSYPLDRPLYYIRDASRAIALTIDDGPDPEYTPQVLRLLRQHQSGPAAGRHQRPRQPALPNMMPSLTATCR